jgi:transcriptional regulator with XRE-family HTH domain
MQEKIIFLQIPPYNPVMTAGRPAKFKRSKFGERLFSAHQQLGGSQIQMAGKLGITQAAYAGWERRTTALKPEHISRLAALLNVTVEYLLGHQDPAKRYSGPVGKARQVFEEVSRLPRREQQRIIGLVEDLLTAHRLQHTPREAQP